MKGSVVIAGIGHTPFGKLPDRSTVALNTEACRAALADAGLDKGAVDGVFVKTPSSTREFMYGQKVSEALGLQPKIGGAWDQGGAANITLLNFAALAIENGQCDVALVCYADNPKTGNKAHFGRPRGDDTSAYGWFSTAAGYGMIQRAHMLEYGTSEEAFGQVAMAARNHGANNPAAQLRIPLTMDNYLSSKWVIDPLRRDDCCLVSDGGAALVVMSARRASELGVEAPVPILGFGHGQTSWEIQARPSLLENCAGIAAHDVFKSAGIGPETVDVAQLYDCFSVTALMALEDYGFCKKGQVGDFVAEGRISSEGDLPINTSGGLLSESGMPGLQLIMEGVRQMRGSSVNQVVGARNCLVTNQGGTMHTHASMILGG